MRHAMIMAGGAGTRLWPMSRKHLPKQLVRFLRDETTGEWRSLLKLAVDRLETLVPPENIYICTNEAYRHEINNTIPNIKDDNILGEPVGRDTVNAVGFAAAVIHKRDPDAVFATLTADQIITPEDQFRETLDTGFRAAEDDRLRLVTFAITPTYPATGFGYVEKGAPITIDGKPPKHPACLVENFAEKPDAQRAAAYVESGNYGWNSGMFIWTAQTILDCLRRYKPESYQGIEKIKQAWDTPDQTAVLNDIYPNLPKISVDYAIMEPASREQRRAAERGELDTAIKVCTVEMDLQWLDVGSWPSYAETLTADDKGNKASGNAQLLKNTNTLVVNNHDDHLVACIGCDNLIVVHTKDATLVMPADRAQELKSLHEQLPGSLK